MKPLRIIFIGSSEFGIAALKRISESVKPLLVITQPDRPQGRNLSSAPCPLAKSAAELGIKLFKPDNINFEETLQTLHSLMPDLFVTASYGGMLGKRIRNLAARKAINLHPSLLPKYRGAAPIQSALLAGDRTTGMTIFRLTASLDAGPIIMQQKLEIDEGENYSSLHERLANLASEMLIEYLANIDAYEAKLSPQDDSLATQCGKFEKQDMLLDWHQPAESVVNRIRAFSLKPGAFQYYNNEPLKFLSAVKLETPLSGEPGSIDSIIKNTGFTVNCADHPILIKTIQPAGKKIMDSWAWLLGSRAQTGDKLWK
ncbi:MAG: methionyl-tRNA formyltransferase [Candidatus Cloacimonadaceae bacterium]|nr:methionyl-tRNA formyltransferase [Candidatus Cloacimonadaceae bacterium]